MKKRKSQIWIYRGKISRGSIYVHIFCKMNLEMRYFKECLLKLKKLSMTSSYYYIIWESLFILLCSNKNNDLATNTILWTCYCRLLFVELLIRPSISLFYSNRAGVMKWITNQIVVWLMHNVEKLIKQSCILLIRLLHKKLFLQVENLYLSIKYFYCNYHGTESR